MHWAISSVKFTVNHEYPQHTQSSLHCIPPSHPNRYDYEDVFRALLLGVEEAVARTRKNWKAASTDMAQYRNEEHLFGLVDW